MIFWVFYYNKYFFPYLINLAWNDDLNTQLV